VCYEAQLNTAPYRLFVGHRNLSQYITATGFSFTQGDTKWLDVKISRVVDMNRVAVLTMTRVADN
jgi:hypothetical protein